jgi:hypothetical protein
LTVEIAPERELVSGTLRVRFTPDLATRKLVFRLWANSPRLWEAGSRLNPGPVESRHRRLAVSRPDRTTLEVSLGETLDPGKPITVSLPWRLQLPGPLFDRISQEGDSIRLGSFFPILAWEPSEGWVTDPATKSLAETSTTPTADFDVAIETPPGLDVLATGRSAGHSTWKARAVRDFAVVTGHFDTASTTARAPDPVRVTVGVDGSLDEPAEAYLRAVVRALGKLSDLYGPYPWATLNVAVTPNLEGAGIEYPTLVTLGAGTVGVVTDHEVAHMWFYSLVGSDPAVDPWLDEGLTTYAQARIDGDVGFFSSRSVPEEVAGHLGRPMSFWDHHQDDYFEGVYGQTVKALAALGSPGRVDCALHGYVEANAYDIAEPADLFAALDKAGIRGAAGTLARFGAP